MAWITDDPIRDFEAYDRECQELLEKHPKCDKCDKYITDEEFYDIDGEYVCEECLNKLYRVYTDDYMEE